MSCNCFTIGLTRIFRVFWSILYLKALVFAFWLSSDFSVFAMVLIHVNMCSTLNEIVWWFNYITKWQHNPKTGRNIYICPWVYIQWFVSLVNPGKYWTSTTTDCIATIGRYTIKHTTPHNSETPENPQILILYIYKYFYNSS